MRACRRRRRGASRPRGHRARVGSRGAVHAPLLCLSATAAPTSPRPTAARVPRVDRRRVRARRGLVGRVRLQRRARRRHDVLVDHPRTRRVRPLEQQRQPEVDDPRASVGPPSSHSRAIAVRAATWVGLRDQDVWVARPEHPHLAPAPPRLPQRTTTRRPGARPRAPRSPRPTTTASSRSRVGPLRAVARALGRRHPGAVAHRAARQERHRLVVVENRGPHGVVALHGAAVRTGVCPVALPGRA